MTDAAHGAARPTPMVCDVLDVRRLAALDGYGILDTPAEAGFDDIVLLASQICGAPVALVSLVSSDRQWFKARIGFELDETPLDQSVCRHALNEPGLLVIPDLSKDPRTRDNPLVSGEPGVRFYAGARLETSEGVPLGTLCVVDLEPREDGLTTKQAASLEALARQVMALMELRRVVEKQRTDREFLESILASSDDCIKVLDLEGALIFMSEGGQRIMEVGDFDKIRGCPWPDFWHDALNLEAKAAMAGALAGRSGHFQGRTNTFAGTPKWWDVRVTPILNANGEPEKLLAISRDITVAREAEDALREAQGLNTLVLNSSADCIVVLDLEGHTQFVSPGGIEAMEVSDVDAIMGLSWLRVWQGEDNQAARAAVAEARAGRIGRFQGYCPTHKGTPKWWDVMISPLRGADGAPERLMSVGRDITLSRETARKLARSDERLKLALGASGMVGIWDWDLKAGLIYADANFARVYNVDPAWAARGAPLDAYLKSVYPDDLAELEAALDRLFAGGDDFAHEYRTVQPDGSVQWLLARGRLVRDQNGTAVRFPGATVEITERKQSETRRLALLHVGDRLRDMLDPGEMAFVAAEIMGKTLDASRAGFGKVDPDGETIVIERDWHLQGIGGDVGTHHFRNFGSYIDDLTNGTTVVINDVRLDPRTAVNADAFDSLFIRAIINIPVLENGRLVAIFYVHVAAERGWSPEEIAWARNVADRTWIAIERRRAEHALRDLNAGLERRVEERTWELRQSQARLAAYFDASPEYLSVVRLTPDDVLVYDDLNPACETLFGLKRADVIGRSPHAVLGEISGASVEHHARECLRTRQPLRYEVERTFAANFRIVANVAVAPIELPDNDSTLILFCGRDVSEQRQAEDALRQSQKMEAVGQLTGGVAHDFNNLLTVIRSSVDLLKRPNLSEERRHRYIEAISDTTTRAAKLTGQLLAFARRQALKPEVFDVCKSVETLSDMVGTLIGPRIRIDIQLCCGGCFVDADPSQFDTALVNLAVNARDAMAGEGHLTIKVGPASQIPALRDQTIDGNFVAVSITDNGAGIAPEDMGRIFEPFFTTKGVGQGTGLGLSQVFGFVKQSGGEVAVASTLREGTTVTLYLPRTSARAAKQREPETGGPLVEGHGTCVLIVEDNEGVGSFATQTLNELGYFTVLANNAESALIELQTNSDRFDVMFSDVVMPGMNGIDLAREVQRRHSGLAIVLTSGYSTVLAESGTHGFELLHKPYSVEQLSRVLQKAVHRRGLNRILGPANAAPRDVLRIAADL